MPLQPQPHSGATTKLAFIKIRNHVQEAAYTEKKKKIDFSDARGVKHKCEHVFTRVPQNLGVVSQRLKYCGNMTFYGVWH